MKEWNITDQISGKHTANDGQILSYNIRMDKRYETICHRRFLRKLHNVDQDTDAKFDRPNAAAADKCIPANQPDQLAAERKPRINVRQPVRYRSGFPFQISDRGGNAPPPMGGGLSLQGGGMTRNFDATTICVMHDIIYKQHHTLCML